MIIYDYFDKDHFSMITIIISVTVITIYKKSQEKNKNKHYYQHIK
jgi:hypothetical protein